MKVSTYIIILLAACGLGAFALVLSLSYFNSRVEQAQDSVSEYRLTQQELSRFTDSFRTWLITSDQILLNDQAMLLPNEREIRTVVDGQLRRIGESRLGQEIRAQMSEVEIFVRDHKARIDRATVLIGENRQSRLRELAGEYDTQSERVVVTLDQLDGVLRTRINEARARHASTIDTRMLASWVMVALYLGFIVIAWRWTARTISAPLRKLSREAKEAAVQGNLIQQVKTGPQEIVNLSRTFASLVGRMDEKVRMRTEHLAKTNRELEKARVDAVAASEAKSEFLTNVSHELRTPLSSIRASAGILREFPDEVKETRLEFSEIILLESERLTRLIDNVLDLGKIQSGRQEWAEEPVQVADTLFEVVRACNVESRVHGIEVELDVKGRLPEIVGDRDRLAQLWTNLVGNAIKFTEKGDNVQVRAMAEANIIVVEVEDKGPGIRPEDQDVIFERFRQVSDDTLTDKPNGTGLGLPIAREIAERHGAEIHVESEMGQGTTFTVLLPVHRETGITMSL